jgi:hypothetical protein
MEAKFKYYITERHGYVQTTIAYLRKLKISKLISPYSRQLGTKVFLEEDGDLNLFIKRHTVKDTTVILEEDYSKKQQHFDNMFNFKDTECQDEQFDGFKSDWEISQYVSFNKPDNIKHIAGNNFKTPDDKTLKIVPTFYLDGKLLNDKQLEKLGITINLAHTKECNIQ